MYTVSQRYSIYFLRYFDKKLNVDYVRAKIRAFYFFNSWSIRVSQLDLKKLPILTALFNVTKRALYFKEMTVHELAMGFFRRRKVK